MLELKHNTIQYNLALPNRYDPTEKHPLIIYLHGAGGRGHDLKNVGYPYMMESYILEHDLNVMVAAPLCEFDNWYMCFTELIEFVRFASTMEGVDPDRVYLMGSSMGGYATWAMLMCVPELIAAAVPICGGGMPWNCGRFKDMPLRVIHGVEDGAVDFTESVKMVRAARAFGAKVEFILLPDWGHNVWEPALYELGCVEWLMEHRRK